MVPRVPRGQVLPTTHARRARVSVYFKLDLNRIWKDIRREGSEAVDRT
jgi:hypothetical protein